MNGAGAQLGLQKLSPLNTHTLCYLGLVLKTVIKQSENHWKRNKITSHIKVTGRKQTNKPLVDRLGFLMSSGNSSKLQKPGGT